MKESKKVMIGLALFIVVTVASFFIASTMFRLSESLSAIIGIFIGFVVELCYRKYS